MDILKQVKQELISEEMDYTDVKIELHHIETEEWQYEHVPSVNVNNALVKKEGDSTKIEIREPIAFPFLILHMLFWLISHTEGISLRSDRRGCYTQKDVDTNIDLTK